MSRFWMSMRLIGLSVIVLGIMVKMFESVLRFFFFGEELTYTDVEASGNRAFHSSERPIW